MRCRLWGIGNSLQEGGGVIAAEKPLTLTLTFLSPHPPGGSFSLRRPSFDAKQQFVPQTTCPAPFSSETVFTQKQAALGRVYPKPFSLETGLPACARPVPT